MAEKGKDRQPGRRRIASSRARRASSNRVAYAVAAAAIVFVVALVTVAYVQQYVLPFRRVVITIDGRKIGMREFLQRAELSGSTSGLGVLQSMTNEVVINDAAAELGISVTPQEVDQELRRQAAGGSDNATVTDAEFREWYRQQLNEKKVTDSMYRKQTEASLLYQKVYSQVTKDVPTLREHAHVYIIYTNTYEDAVAAKQRVDAGEDFSEVAREVSVDPNSAEKGGELEWVPDGVYVYNQDPAQLQIGKTSDALAIVDDPSQPPTNYYVIIVTERAMMETAPENMPEIQGRVFQQWLNDKTKEHQVKWNYNSEIDAWVSWQLTKMMPTSPTPAGG